MEIWDGSPRRKNDLVLFDLTSKVDSIYAFLQREFGNTKDDGFGKKEGDTKRDIRELKEQVSKQNGRIGKSEDSIALLKEWRKYVLGGISMFMFLAGIIVTLIATHK